MTEQLKFVVQELNKPPFNKNFNLINFDALEPSQLLQVLSDVFLTIEGKVSMDIRQEASDETALRLFNTLKVIKFKPPSDPDELSVFRQGVVEGDKHVIYPLLTWVLQKVPELQKRVYLGRFLVKIDVPPEFIQDPDVEQLYNQCDDLMEQFKAVHKEAEAVRSEGLTTEDIRQDIKSMEDERDQLVKRIERLKKKVESTPQREKMLEMARNLRLEAEKEAELLQNKAEQRNMLVHAEQKIHRIQSQIKEIKQTAENMRPEDIIQKLEEENRTNSYLVLEKLPKEISLKRKAVMELQKVASLPAMDQSDIQQIQTKIDEVNNEINRLVEQRNLKNDPTEDKLAIFRQQASMVERKKEAAAEKLNEARVELKQMESQLTEKKNSMRDSEGNEIITATSFKNYVNKLRAKSNLYKRKRQELQDLRAEIGVVARTEEILKQQEEQIRKTLVSMGKDPDEATDELESSSLSMDKKMVNEGDLPSAIKQANSTLDMKKNQLAPYIQELRKLREMSQQIAEEHSTKKSQYDAMAASLESGFSRLEQEVKQIRAEVNNAESTRFRMETEKKIAEALLERAETESTALKSGDKQKSFRDRLNVQIGEAEELGKKLRDEQKNNREAQEDSAKQIRMWRDLQKVMEVKKSCWEQSHGGRQQSGEDRWQAAPDQSNQLSVRPKTSASRGSSGSSSTGRPQTSRKQADMMTL